MNALIIGGFFGILLMMCGVFVKNKLAIQIIAILGLVLMMIGNHYSYQGVECFNFDVSAMLNFSAFSYLLTTIIFAATLFFILLSGKDMLKVGNHYAEYFALIFFMLSGIILLVVYKSLLILFLGIEIVSIPLYVLAGTEKQNLKSNEASLKYFLMGVFSTAIFLMGIVLLYGATASFDIYDIHINIIGAPFLIFGGMIFMIVALAFKVSAAPFHFWTPDVYEGTPTVFTSLMATVVKVASFVAFMRLLSTVFMPAQYAWHNFVVLMIVLTLIVGNIIAIFQQSVKRMLAYSSIAHAGFMLFAVLSLTQMAYEGMILYAISYSLATIGIFAVLAKLDDYAIEGFNGLAKQQPWIAFSVLICLLSLVGIPLTAGFLSKLYMLEAVLKMNHTHIWLIVFAVIMSAISLVYYFKIIKAMFFKTGETVFNNFSLYFKLVLTILVLLIILFGLFPNLVIDKLYF